MFRKIALAWVNSGLCDWILFLGFGVASTLFFVVGPLRLVMFPGSVAAAQIMAAGAITMIGFTLTVVTLIVGHLSTALRRLDEKWNHGSEAEIKQVVFKPLGWLMGLLVVSLACVALQGEFDRLAGGAIVGLTIAATSAIARNVWILRRLTVVAGKS